LIAKLQNQKGRLNIDKPIAGHYCFVLVTVPFFARIVLLGAEPFYQKIYGEYDGYATSSE